VGEEVSQGSPVKVAASLSFEDVGSHAAQVWHECNVYVSAQQHNAHVGALAAHRQQVKGQHL
jgi:hypothetical protein